MDLPLKIAVACVFGQAGLTLVVLGILGWVRIAELEKRVLRLRDVALSTDFYPEHIQKIQNNARNQFETPVLLYAGVGLAAALDGANWVLALASVAYVASRIVHAIIHTGGNNVRHRFYAFLFGLAALAALWLALGLELAWLA